MKTLIILALFAFSAFGEAAKQKAQKAQKVKIVYVEKVAPKPLSQYELCKRECEIQRDTQSTKERVEQLKQELTEAEELLAEHNKHVDAPEIPEQRQPKEGVEVVQTVRRTPSRYDHLKMAASKIAETGSELRRAVTGGGDN